MFLQQLHDFDACARSDARLASVNVQLEQRTHTIGSIIVDHYVQRSLAVDISRALVDAVQRTQQLTRARVAIKRCGMQKRPTFL